MKDDDSQSRLPCVDKLVFDSRVAAEAAAATLRWQRGTKLRAYLCKYCQLWHLSSN